MECNICCMLLSRPLLLFHSYVTSLFCFSFLFLPFLFFFFRQDDFFSFLVHLSYFISFLFVTSFLSLFPFLNILVYFFLLKFCFCEFSISLFFFYTRRAAWKFLARRRRDYLNAVWCLVLEPTDFLKFCVRFWKVGLATVLLSVSLSVRHIP